ncbi:cobalamin-binding protein [Tundrisphaera sp. TA3]|uniref:cobalamin-binding protein n=1 Tax=Tundrisphaera sp. TA3 TaxID=3435775 RepID=UPI003EBD0467
MMRIVSLLPSLTELVWALGRGEDLVGVTHECDYPPEVVGLPTLTASRIPAAATSAAIDALVAEERGSLYDLDADRLAELRPDLILTQEQCDVCAVNEKTVRRVAATLPGNPRVESVNPLCLEDLHAMFRMVGDLLDARPAAEVVVARFERTAQEIAERREGLGRPLVLQLEWLDPPFCSGHWNPEIVDLAGGVEVIGRAGAASRRIAWDEIARGDPDLILLAPCGFPVERTEAELADALASGPIGTLRAAREGKIAVTDGSAYFSRPGPRLEESLRIAAAAIDPDRCGDLAPEGSWRFIPPRA